MITRIAAAVVTALTMGSGSAAFAAAMDHDPTTGLSTYYYYGPISKLANKNLPLKEGTSKYFSSPQRASRKQTTPVLLLENRGARPAVKHRQ
jgi:hypothetical protein